MIGIVDYGSGNIRAIGNVYSRLDIKFKVVKSAQDFVGVRKIVLPGVGAFDQVVRQLEESGFRDILGERVVKEGMPALGICVGMQILAKASEEGVCAGLGWIEGFVKRLDTTLLPNRTRLPHMGWNDVSPERADGLFEGLGSDAQFYFLHSYVFVCENSENVLAKSQYGESFACAVRKDNIYGVQFHPEKSHHFGVRLLRNFAEM
jgi:imidazole glycerol-phosphate synthase subunit HisH